MIHCSEKQQRKWYIVVRNSSGWDIVVRNSSGSDILVRDSNGSDIVVRDSSGSDIVVRDSNRSDILVRDSNRSDIVVRDSNGSDILVRDSNGSDIVVRDSNGSDVALRYSSETHIALKKKQQRRCETIMKIICFWQMHFVAKRKRWMNRRTIKVRLVVVPCTRQPRRSRPRSVGSLPTAGASSLCASPAGLHTGTGCQCRVCIRTTLNLS